MNGTVLTTQLIARKKAEFLSALKVCSTIERASYRASIPRSTLYRWLKNDAAFNAAANKILVEKYENDLLLENTRRSVASGV